jgi:hypothetical protein
MSGARSARRADGCSGWASPRPGARPAGSVRPSGRCSRTRPTRGRRASARPARARTGRRCGRSGAGPGIPGGRAQSPGARTPASPSPCRRWSARTSSPPSPSSWRRTDAAAA